MTCPTPHKLQFASRCEALTWIKAHPGKRVYRCPFGEHWHISSMTRRAGRRARKQKLARLAMAA